VKESSPVGLLLFLDKVWDCFSSQKRSVAVAIVASGCELGEVAVNGRWLVDGRMLFGSFILNCYYPALIGSGMYRVLILCMILSDKHKNLEMFANMIGIFKKWQIINIIFWG
jgi:hypothetical protein